MLCCGKEGRAEQMLGSCKSNNSNSGDGVSNQMIEGHSCGLVYGTASKKEACSVIYSTCTSQV